MLVVSRKQEQSIRVGDDVIVRVVAIEGKRVRLAIEAPRQVRILRGELLAEEKGASTYELHSSEVYT
jgi:carbon storage regulator